MASDTVNDVEISLKDSSTQSVTLGRVHATVVREITGVAIKPGPNRIAIYGFDPLVSPESVRVSGRGPATITDTQTEVIPQKERLNPFSDDWDSSSDDFGDSDDDNAHSDSELGLDRSELQRAQVELQDMEAKLAAAKDDEAAASQCLEFLDSYGKTLRGHDVQPATVNEYLQLYKTERPQLNQQHQQAITLKGELERKIKQLRREEGRLSRAFQKAKQAATKAQRQKRAEKRSAQMAHKAEKRRLREEKTKFHPINIGQLVLHLDGFGDGSQGSSRRNSTASATSPNPKDPAPSNSETLSLSVTYVVQQATWTPRYEVFLETPSASGKIAYRAEYHNSSSETWKDTKVIFSNSQTSFSGVNEVIPALQAWNVKLLKDETRATSANTKAHWKNAIANDAEVQAQFAKKKAQGAFGNVGFGNVAFNGAQQGMLQQQQQQQQQQRQPMQQQMMAPRAQRAAFDGSANRTRGGGLFGASLNAYAPPPDEGPEVEEEGYESDDSDNSTLAEHSDELAFQESSRHDYGLTTNFELSGHRTLQPSSLARRHIIAELNIPSVTYSHVIVPKMRPAAFLKARFVNTSSTSFLRGKAGLTLDGTFLGTTFVPNCSPNLPVNLSLGVDPAILVHYAKPTVRRATTGFFNKEDCAIFTRVCRIVNTKSSSVSVTVFDQVPVSEDERLRVRILEPKGIEKDGDSAKMGSEVSKRAWGKGTVRMGKNGEVKWEMTIEKGAEVRLTLEYDARIPTGQKIVGLEGTGASY